MNKKYYLIYQITNNINGKIYIGKHETDNLDDDYFGSGKHLKHAQKKYGLKNFTKTILYYLQNKEEMNLLEKMVVNEAFCKRKDTYNIKIGGDGGFDYINKNNLNTSSEAHKIGGLAYAKKLKEDVDFRNRISNNLKQYWKKHPDRLKVPHCDWTGKHHTEETKQKISKANKGKHTGCFSNTQDTVWISNEELRVSFAVPNTMLYDYIGIGYIKGRVCNWDNYFDRKVLIDNHISVSHLSPSEKILFKNHQTDEIIRLRKLKKEQDKIDINNRVKELQEIADYYSIHGFKQTKLKYGNIKGLTSLENMLGTFSHYKKYGLKFEAKNNIKGQINGSWII